MTFAFLAGADGSWIALLPQQGSKQSAVTMPNKPHPFHDIMQVSRAKSKYCIYCYKANIAEKTVTQPTDMHRCEEASWQKGAET